MKLPSVEKGDLEVLTIAEQEGSWEEPWEALRGTVVGKLFSRVSRRNLNHILHGFSNPFVNALGISPEGALQKLPESVCKKHGKCPFYDSKACTVRGKKPLPWCFEPDVSGFSQKATSAAAEAAILWREGVYLVVVYDA